MGLEKALISLRFFESLFAKNCFNYYFLTHLFGTATLFGPKSLLELFSILSMNASSLSSSPKRAREQSFSPKTQSSKEVLARLRAIDLV